MLPLEWQLAMESSLVMSPSFLTLPFGSALTNSALLSAAFHYLFVSFSSHGDFLLG
jgi:hypothetical protein